MTLHSDDRPADAVVTVLFHGTQSYRHYREKIGCPNGFLECFQDNTWIDTEWTLDSIKDTSKEWIIKRMVLWSKH